MTGWRKSIGFIVDTTGDHSGEIPSGREAKCSRVRLLKYIGVFDMPEYEQNFFARPQLPYFFIGEAPIHWERREGHSHIWLNDTDTRGLILRSFICGSKSLFRGQILPVDSIGCVQCRSFAGIGYEHSELGSWNVRNQKHLFAPCSEVTRKHLNRSYPGPLIQMGTLDLSPDEKSSYARRDSGDYRSDGDPVVWLVPERFYGWFFVVAGAVVTAIGILCAGSQGFALLRRLGGLRLCWLFRRSASDVVIACDHVVPIVKDATVNLVVYIVALNH